MMALFRDIGELKPTASFEERIDWAARRDPIGHKVHLALAVFALTLIPLSSSLASIGSTPLLVYTLMRAPTIRHTWVGLLKNGSLLCLIGLYLWLAISLLWSPDPEQGIRLLRGTRFLLIIPALVPLLRHANLLAAAICLSVFIQNIAQMFEWGLSDEYFRGGGLDNHPGFTGLWFILATGILITLPSPGRSPRILQRSSAIIPMVGITLSGARSILLGMTTGLFALFMSSVIRRSPGWKITAASCVVLAGVLLAPTLRPESAMNQRLAETATGLRHIQNSETGAPEVVPGTHRFTWWKIGFRHWQDSWLIGEGLGSAENAIDNDPGILEITEGGTTNLRMTRNDYHSLFVTAAAESGVIGLVLVTLWLTLVGFQLPNAGRLGAAVMIGFVGYTVFSVFNTTIFSGRVVCLPLVIMALSMHPLPESRTLSRAIADESPPC